MSCFDNMFERLDEKLFLGFQVWEFSFHSLAQGYGWLFLRKVVLRPPFRTLRGILEYPRFLRAKRREGDITWLFWGEEESFLEEMGGGKEPLIAVGFCMKPFDCPAGRPNHTCLYLATPDPYAPQSPSTACQGCKVAVIGQKALEAGAAMHIMTSALDIAHDLLIPSLEAGRNAILILCPLSVQAITLPLIICGIRGWLVEYASGNCRDYEEWLRADRGIKEERTTLSPGAWEKVTGLLYLLASRRRGCIRFERQGNIYWPVGEPPADECASL